jgi:hypothetical protein
LITKEGLPSNVPKHAHQGFVQEEPSQHAQNKAPIRNQT